MSDEDKNKNLNTSENSDTDDDSSSNNKDSKSDSSSSGSDSKDEDKGGEEENHFDPVASWDNILGTDPEGDGYISGFGNYFDEMTHFQLEYYGFEWNISTMYLQTYEGIYSSNSRGFSAMNILVPAMVLAFNGWLADEGKIGAGDAAGTTALLLTASATAALMPALKFDIFGIKNEVIFYKSDTTVGKYEATINETFGCLRKSAIWFGTTTGTAIKDELGISKDKAAVDTTHLVASRNRLTDIQERTRALNSRMAAIKERCIASGQSAALEAMESNLALINTAGSRVQTSLTEQRVVATELCNTITEITDAPSVSQEAGIVTNGDALRSSM